MYVFFVGIIKSLVGSISFDVYIQNNTYKLYTIYQYYTHIFLYICVCLHDMRILTYFMYKTIYSPKYADICMYVNI